MASRATSFYYAFLALPREKRDAIIAVWDFCRAVDDAVDEAETGEAAAAPERWRAEVGRLYSAAEPQTVQGRALQPFIRRFGLPRSAFDDLIDGVAMDLECRRYDTFDALRQYCLRVASAVGLICVEIFGYRDVRTRDYAIELGIALQLTNIVRDVAADLERGRVYIPQEDLRRFGCSEQDLKAGVLNDRMKNLLAFECGRAREYFIKAAATLPKIDARRVVAAQMMAAIYEDLLMAIERAGYDVFRQRIRVPRPRQLFVSAKTWARIVALARS